MNERKLYQKGGGSVEERLRKEWVTLDKGDICVWEFTAAETMQIQDRSVRPNAAGTPDHVDLAEASLWQLLMACRVNDQPGAAKLWGIGDLEDVQSLRQEEYNRILMAIDRLNGDSSAEAERLRDFTPAAGDERNGTSSLGVSSTLVASPQN